MIPLLPVPQVVERGEGVAPYRARLGPALIRVHLCGFESGLLVLRCHDFDLAVALVLDADDFADLDALVDSAARVWVRYVPDDYEHPDAGGSWERELRGTIGATPAVLFASPNPAHADHEGPRHD